MQKLVLFTLLSFVYFSSSAQQSVSQDDNQHLYEQALAAFRDESFSASKVLFSQYLKGGSSTYEIEAKYLLAYSSLKTGDNTAIAELQKFIETEAEHPLAYTGYFVIGNHYFNDKNYKKALQYYTRISPQQLNPADQEEWYFKRGYSHAVTGKSQDAVQDFKTAIQFDGDFLIDASYYLGQLYFRASDFPSALSVLKPVDIGDGTYSDEITALMAGIYFEQGNYEKLYNYAGERVTESVTSSNRTLNHLMGEAYYMEKKYRQAARHLQRHLDLSGNKATPEIYFKLAFSFFRINENKKAIDYFKLAGLEKGDMGQSASFYLGQLYLRENNLNYALSAFRNVTLSGSNEEMAEEAAFLVGKINYDREQFAEAITDFNAFLAEYPQSRWVAETNELLAQAYLKTSNYDEAIAHLEQIRNKSTFLKSAYQKVTFQKGQLQFNDGKFNDAITSLEKAVAFPVEKGIAAHSFYLLGDSYSLAGQDQKAAEAYLNSKRFGRNTWAVNAEYGLAYIHYNQKNYAKAEDYFGSFIRGTTKDHDFYFDAKIRLADCRYVQKKYGLAIALYEEIRGETAFQRDYIFYQLGLAYNLKGDRKRSQANLLRVLDKPNSAFADNALFQLSQVHIETSEFEAAIPYLDQLIAKFPSSVLIPYARSRRALSHFNLNHLTRAKDDYAYVLEHHIRHPSANAALLGLQEVMNKGETVTDFEHYLEVYRQTNPDDKSLEVIAFEAAKADYFNQDYPKAIAALNAYIARYPSSGFLVDAYYFLADAYYRHKSWEQAVMNFDQLLNFENTAYISRALDKRGKALVNLGDYKKAVVNYRNLLRTSISPKDTYLAHEGLMNAYFSMDHMDSTLYFANQILANEWKPANAASAAWLIRGKVLLQQRNYSGAQDEFIKVINDSRNEAGAEAKYLLAKVFHQQNKYNRSLETLFDLNRNYGSYPYWIGRSFLLIADNYLAMDELLQAEATLNSIVANAKNEEIVALARERLTKVRVQREEILKADSTKPDTIK